MSLLWAGARPVSAGEEDRQRTFLRALDLFDHAKTPEDFQRSALLFEGLLGDGYENGAVLYNLGNACMRAGHVGHALAAYRRAQRLLPRDPYVEANLNAARAASPEALRPEGAPWWKRVLFWHTWLAQTERQRAGALAFGLAFLLGVARLFRPPGGRGRPLLGWSALLALCAGALLSLSAALGYQEELRTRHGVVVAPEAQARKGNGESYAPAFDRPLKEGAEFMAVESREGWVRARFAEAGEGWVREKDVVLY